MSSEMNISQLHVLKVKHYTVLQKYVELLKRWCLNVLKRVLLEPWIQAQTSTSINSSLPNYICTGEQYHHRFVFAVTEIIAYLDGATTTNNCF